MKLYNKLRNLKKSTKIGLATSAVYAATLALPAFANQGTEKPVDTEQVMTAQQTKNIYEIKLAEYTEDKKLTSPEIEKLNGVLAQYLELRKNKSVIKSENPEIKKGSINDSIDVIICEFEQEILPYYPGLVSNLNYSQTILKYDAFKSINEGKNLRSLIERTYKLTEEKALEPLLDKEIYEIRDLIFFNELLRSSNILKEKKESQIKLPNVKSLILSDTQFRVVKSAYELYLENRDKNSIQASRFWGGGVLMWSHIGPKSKFFKKGMVDKVEEALNIQGYKNVEIRGFYDGVKFKGKFPYIPNWLMLTFGIVFPFVRNGLLAKYTKREFDEFDIAEGMFGGAAGLIIDALHPWVFPIRMFGTPIVFEPARRILNLQ